MIVYRNHKQQVHIASALERVRGPHLDPTTLLIELGELETAIVDALCPEADSDTAVARALRRASLAAAHVFCGKPWRTRVLAELDGIETMNLPVQATVGVPEGYAWYGLYPETYLEAARRYFRAIRPRHVVVVGIRNIGTSLSAVVAATLIDCGCTVDSITVRPRGHPFDRHVVLAPGLEWRLRQLTGCDFAIVDEGPGLSGSSLASVAEALSRLGIADSRIAFFPSWIPDGNMFVSERARERWRRHAKYCASFEEIMPLPGTRDISAGAWRELLFDDESQWPAVQPQHERRKFLDGDALLKFAGLGRYGAVRLERARELANAGFCPPALGLDSGFLRTTFVDGRPLSGPGDIGADLVDTMARYLAHLGNTFESRRPVPFDDLVEMIRTNTGYEVPGGLRATICDAPTVAIDGRMLPHEWIVTADGYLKTDAVDHHDDHFYPGCQDIAWDIAGAAVEFCMDPVPLLERYAAIAGDRDVARRLPFYIRAYSAWRLGYATLARTAIAGTADAARFERLAERYASSAVAAP